ncbi:class I SAM-dependent methyltransferase [Agrobacterium tumefaciens]|uniref:class I SAM-dependent methyltransferase n=1 Tax=Agrobacterium tumefaciens TaxID=358 RepID=UPI0012B75320|nr:class I SAM-dependent methyltransferase [Agrobacterium tumefaciens]MQB08165.1 class I SAM-dependent methyltransferase [Agrobacterium tumefaciens]
MSVPFSSPGFIDRLYSTEDRLKHRTSALLCAKIAGRNPVDDGIHFLHKFGRATPTYIADIGCGRGSSTDKIAQRLAPERLYAFDRSAAMVQATLAGVGSQKVEGIVGDFHKLPFEAGYLSGSLLAFCLYHSDVPGEVVEEVLRCTRAEGVCVLVTKSIESYAEIDTYIGRAGLNERSSGGVYSSFSSENAVDIVRSVASVLQITEDKSVFHYPNADHLLAYLQTSPVYADDIAKNPADFATVLRAAWPNDGLRVTSRTTVIACKKET